MMKPFVLIAALSIAALCNNSANAQLLENDFFGSDWNVSLTNADGSVHCHSMFPVTFSPFSIGNGVFVGQSTFFRTVVSMSCDNPNVSGSRWITMIAEAGSDIGIQIQSQLDTNTPPHADLQLSWIRNGGHMWTTTSQGWTWDFHQS